VRKISADYIFPIASSPIKNGIVYVDDKGTILDVINPANNSNHHIGVEYYKGIICPGFINSHCHLELSYLKGKLPTATGLDDFIKNIEANKQPPSASVYQAIAAAENEMLKNGIVAVGDISNSNVSFLQKAKEYLTYHTFIELFAFDSLKADKTFAKGLELLREYTAFNLKSSASITPHAPYSVSQTLLKQITALANQNNSLLTIHNQESKEEDKLFQFKQGKILERLRYFGINTDLWQATGLSALQSTLAYVPQNQKILLVHNTYTCLEDIQWAQQYNANIYWCFCPNANLYIESTLPDIENFITENAKITIGTDSLASNWSLSVLDELKTIASHYHKIPLNTLLRWATKNAADFFNFPHLGSIEKGKKPGLNWVRDLNNLQLTENASVVKLI